MKWQPIETAPKNERILLLRNGVITCGHFNDDRYAKTPRPYWRHDLEAVYGIRDARAMPPTHWAPLPPQPPKETSHE